MTVHQLRRLGYTVCVNHCRRYFDPVNKRYSYLTEYERTISELPEYVTMLPTGGFTNVQIMNADRHYYRNGTARCSEKENYNKKAGVSLAIERALSSEVDLYIK